MRPRDRFPKGWITGHDGRLGRTGRRRIAGLCAMVFLGIGFCGCGDETSDAPPPRPPTPAVSPPTTSAATRPARLLAPVAMDPHSGMVMPPNHPPLSGGDAPTSMPVPSRLLKFTTPSRWKEEAPAPMRVAQYRLPRVGDDPDDGLVAVSSFPSMRGRTQMNIERWIGQFSQPDGRASKDLAKTSEFDVGGMKVTVLSISGTYEGRPNQRMLAAIIDTPDGPWFVKMTGPARTIAENEAAFDAFVRSAKY